MKLRISGDSLRLRLSPVEIARLRDLGAVADAIRFGPGGGTFTYELLRAEEAEEISIERRADAIAVRVPATAVDEWAGTDQVGIEATLANGADGLRVLLEKDWQCLTAREGEDESHLYPNPAAPQ